MLVDGLQQEDFTMMSKDTKKALSKTIEMPEITKALLRYSDLECAVLCYLAENSSTEDVGSFDPSLRQTQEMPVIEVDPSDVVESTDKATDDCDEVVEVVLRALAPRIHLSPLRFV